MDRIWTKPFTLVTGGTLFLFSAFYMLYPTLPLYITHMGGTEGQVGLSTGVFMLSAVVFRPVVGGLVDRFGRRPFAVGGVLLFTVALALYGGVGSVDRLIALRFLHGVSWAVSTTAILTLATDLIPAARRGEGLGWYGMAMTVAMAVGPLLGTGLIEDETYDALFLVGVGLSIVALVLLLSAPMRFRPQAGARIRDVYEPSVLPVTIAVFFLFIAYGGITTFVPLFAAALGLNSGLFFLTYAATLVVTRPLAGRLADRYGETAVLLPVLALTVVALVVLSAATGLPGVLLAALLYGIGFGSAMPVLQAITIRLARPERVGVANASFSTATDLGIGIGAMLLGWVSQATSYPVVFLVSAVAVVGCVVIFMAFVQRSLRTPARFPARAEPLPESSEAI